MKPQLQSHGLTRRACLHLAATLPLGWGTGRAVAQQSLPVTIVNTDSNQTRTLQQVLIDRGLFDRFGVTATTINVGDGSKLIGALLSGEADIAMLTGFSQVLPAIERGGKLKVIAGSSLLAPQVLYSAKPEIRSVADLRGKTIGTGSPGALLHMLVVALLEKHGVDPATVTFANVGSSSDVLRAVIARTIDAGPGLSDVYETQEKFGVHSLVGGECWLQLPLFTNQAAITATRTIQSKPEALIRTLAAYCQLFRFVSEPESRDAYVRARQTVLGAANPQQAAEQGLSEWRFIQRYQPYATNLILSDERISYIQDLNLKLGVQKRRLETGDVADMSLAREAVARLS